MNNFYAVSIIPASLAREPGELSTLSLYNAKENLRQSLADRLPLSAWAILGFDISKNLDETKRDERFDPYWQGHWYGVVGGVTTKAELDVLYSMFPKSPAISRPVQIKEITDPGDIMSIISYSMKGGFTRRVSYRAPNGRIASRKVSLKAGETAELMSYLSKLTPTERLLLFRVRRWAYQLMSTV
jgi:hypothetical protein